MDAITQSWFKGSYYERLLERGEVYYSEIGIYKRLVYDHGLPFRQLLADNIDDLMSRINRKKASLLVIDGSVGEGKTTLGLHLGNYVNIRYGSGVPIDPRGPQLALGGKEFSQKIIVCHDQNYKVIIYDEAGDLDKKTTLSKFNRQLMHIFEMYRGFKIMVILCLPRFYKLENELLDLGVWRMTIHCEDRSERQGSFRVYDIEQTYYIKNSATKIIVKPKCYDHGMSNFQGHFLDLPPEESRELDAVSVAAKRKETKKLVYDVKDRLTIYDIAKQFGKTSRWVLLRLKEVDDIGEVKRFERKKYYDQSIIQKIKSLEEGKA